MWPHNRTLPWLVAAGSTLALAVTLTQLGSELRELKREHSLAVESRTALEAEIGSVDVVVDRLIDQRVEPLIRTAEEKRVALEAALIERDDLIDELEASADRLTSTDLEARIAQIDAALADRFEFVESRVDVALDGMVRGRTELEALRARVPQAADPDALWAEIVAPVVQVNGEFSVGSAILLESQPTEDGLRTPVLTAWHVVRDVQDDPADPVTPVPIRIFRRDGSFVDHTASVLAWQADRDIALLELDTKEAVENGARIASYERLLDVSTFDPVFAVGCPLGTEPVPTFGSIATPDHQVDELRYTMINAPTYIGNSGGGIFDAATGELLGVFSKIYNHGNLRPTIVPHMGLVIPLDEVYDWLEDEGFAVAEGPTGSLTIARAETEPLPEVISVAIPTAR